MDFVLDFSQPWKNYGGYTVYLTEREELLQFWPKPNTLSFIERKSKIMKYTKYVQHRQKQPLIFVVGTVVRKR